MRSDMTFLHVRHTALSFKILTPSFLWLLNLQRICLKASKSFKMSYINEKSLHISIHNFKSLGFFEKASVPLKISSKSLLIP
jgi:hypothetical protein